MPNPRLLQLSFKMQARQTSASALCPTSGARISATTSEPFLSQLYRPNNISAARHVGTALGARLAESGVYHIYLDKSGVYYHGKVKALLDAITGQGIVIHSSPYLEPKHLLPGRRTTKGEEGLLEGEQEGDKEELQNLLSSSVNPLPHEPKLPLEYFPSTHVKKTVKRTPPKKFYGYLFEEDDPKNKKEEDPAWQLHPNHPDHPLNRQKEGKE